MRVVEVVWDVASVVGAGEPVRLVAPAGAPVHEVAAAALVGWRNGDRWDGPMPEGYRWARELVEERSRG